MLNPVQLFTILVLSTLAFHALAQDPNAGLSNAQRLRRGLRLAAPRNLYNPSRTERAPRGLPSGSQGNIISGNLGISSVPVDKRRQVGKLTAIGYIQPMGNPFVPAPVSQSEASAQLFTYTQPSSASDYVQFTAKSSSNTDYLGPCAGPTNSYISSTSSNHLALVYTPFSAGVGAYPYGPGSLGAPDFYGCGGDVETTIFTVDDTTGAVSVQYVNPPASVPDGVPTGLDQYPETFVILYEGYLYITGNVALTAASLGGTLAQEVSLFIDAT